MVSMGAALTAASARFTQVTALVLGANCATEHLITTVLTMINAESVNFPRSY